MDAYLSGERRTFHNDFEELCSRTGPIEELWGGSVRCNSAPFLCRASNSFDRGDEFVTSHAPAEYDPDSQRRLASWDTMSVAYLPSRHVSAGGVVSRPRPV